MCAACRELCEKEVINHEDLHVWVDFISVPQRNRHLQKLAIASLGIFASTCRYFVAVTPSTTHNDIEQPCTYETYAMRGWCRLEQWSRLSFSGMSNMFLFRGMRLHPLSEAAGRAAKLFQRSTTSEDMHANRKRRSLTDRCSSRRLSSCVGILSKRTSAGLPCEPGAALGAGGPQVMSKGSSSASLAADKTNSQSTGFESLLVYEGKFSVETDKKHVVDSVLGLYAISLFKSRAEHSVGKEIQAEMRTLCAWIDANRDRMFPVEYFGSLPILVEEAIQHDLDVHKRLGTLLERRSAKQTWAGSKTMLTAANAFLSAAGQTELGADATWQHEDEACQCMFPHGTAPSLFTDTSQRHWAEEQGRAVASLAVVAADRLRKATLQLANDAKNGVEDAIHLDLDGDGFIGKPPPPQQQELQACGGPAVNEQAMHNGAAGHMDAWYALKQATHNGTAVVQPVGMHSGHEAVRGEPTRSATGGVGARAAGQRSGNCTPKSTTSLELEETILDGPSHVAKSNQQSSTRALSACCPARQPPRRASQLREPVAQGLSIPELD